MDIKSVIRSVIPFDVKGPAPARRAKTEGAADRDASGQQQQPGQEQQPRRNLSQAELDEAIQYLEGLPGVKENNLAVAIERTEGIPSIIIRDRDGKVVRRIPEAEISLMKITQNKKSGNLLNKAM